MFKRRQFIELSLLGLLSACVSLNNTHHSSSVTLTISAAASLQDAVQEIGKLYNQQKPDIQLIYNFGSSGSLKRQIEQGAPVDIFISAAEKYVDTLENQNLLLENTRQQLLQNELVLITPKNSQVNKISDLNSNLVRNIALGAPESVPAGKYAKEFLDYLDLYNSLENKLVFAKDVRQVLTYVETGNVEVGIVYQTDVLISQKVKVIATAPKDSHSPITYSVAISHDSKNPEPAQDFINFLFSNSAQNIFHKYGFIALN